MFIIIKYNNLYTLVNENEIKVKKIKKNEEDDDEYNNNNDI